MREIRTEVSDNPKEAATKFLNETLKRYQDTPVLLLVSGGSSLAVLDYVDITLCDDVTVGLADERISRNSEDRNITGLKKIEFVSPAGLHFLPIQQGRTPDESASEYEKVLRRWFSGHNDAHTVVILGIGEDGHTAGMMSGFDKLFNGPRWVVGYDAGDKNPFHLRVTVTNTFLENIADEAIVYVAGEKKRDALKNIHTAPAGIIYKMKKVVLFTDQRIDGRLKP